MELLIIIENLTVTFVTIGVCVINPLALIGIFRLGSLRKETLTPLTYSVFVADMAHIVFLGPVAIYLSWSGITNPPLWLVRVQAFCIIGDVANIASVTLLSIWQTFGIVKPFLFTSVATKKKIWASVILAWIWAFVLAILRVSSDFVFYNHANRYAF